MLSKKERGGNGRNREKWKMQKAQRFNIVYSSKPEQNCYKSLSSNNMKPCIVFFSIQCYNINILDLILQHMSRMI